MADRLRLRRWLPALPAAAALALLLAPEGRLGCADLMVRETSPDGTWTLTLCRRPMTFAMPGGSGDAQGWIVLRDAEGAIRGVVGLSMVQAYGVSGMETSWKSGRVHIPLTAELPLRPASGSLSGWLEERVWRLRAVLGLTPTDDMFR